MSIGGVTLGRVCACSLSSRLVMYINVEFLVVLGVRGGLGGMGEKEG